MNLITNLFDHQIRCVEKLRKIKIGALYLEQGTGKTRTALELIKIRLEKARVEHIIWLCPCSVKENLRRDIIKHAGSDCKDIITICGIETLSSSIKVNCELQQLVKEKECYLIVDESNLVKNFNAKRTKNIITLAKNCKYKLILNGTPISRNETDLFSQWYILDWRVLGYKGYWSFAANHIEYDENIKGKLRRVLNADYLVEKIAPYSYQIKKIDCLDLPEKTYETEYYNLTYEQDKHYEYVANELLFSADELEPHTIYRMFTGIQNVISGYEVTILKNLESSSRKIIGMEKESFFKSPLDNPRIEKLLEIVDKICDQKIIIFAKYTDEINNIVEILNDKYGEDSAVAFNGEVNQNQRQENLERFRNKSNYLVANKNCGAYGLNLQFCSYLIYYSNDWDYSTRIQSEDRVHRIGQNKNVHIIDICAAYTLDERILKCLERKENLVDSFKSELDRTKNKEELYSWIQNKDSRGKNYSKKIKNLDKSDLREEDIKVITFKGEYDKDKFYSLMGKYFAERKYRKIMNYLINDENDIWNLIIDNEIVIGFISYKEFDSKIEIGYCYSEDDKIITKLLKSLPNNKICRVALEKSFNKKLYDKLGYNVYKESTNYWYMELIQNEKVSK